jgi:hypothetical protein
MPSSRSTISWVSKRKASHSRVKIKRIIRIGFFIMPFLPQGSSAMPWFA